NIIVSVRNEASDVRVCFSNPVRQPEQIDLGSLFDRFYTSDKSRRKSTGLGLSIVKLLTERMGGGVFASLEGNVITIGFTLPRQIRQAL
ncbi:MAG: sensor histidine kinase, partial [Clostridia bacterium]|nr:sensor histidine kinase [Clostridia bacterium]